MYWILGIIGGLGIIAYKIYSERNKDDDEKETAEDKTLLKRIGRIPKYGEISKPKTPIIDTAEIVSKPMIDKDGEVITPSSIYALAPDTKMIAWMGARITTKVREEDRLPGGIRAEYYENGAIGEAGGGVWVKDMTRINSQKYKTQTEYEPNVFKGLWDLNNNYLQVGKSYQTNSDGTQVFEKAIYTPSSGKLSLKTLEQLEAMTKPGANNPSGWG